MNILFITLSQLLLGCSTESKVPKSDAQVRVHVGKTEQNAIGNDAGKVKMPRAVLPFGDWPPGSEKVDERTGAIQEYKTLSVADQLEARVGANKEADKPASKDDSSTKKPSSDSPPASTGSSAPEKGKKKPASED